MKLQPVVYCGESSPGTQVKNCHFNPNKTNDEYCNCLNQCTPGRSALAIQIMTDLDADKASPDNIDRECPDIKH